MTTADETKRELTLEEHRERHVMLHTALDELLADYFDMGAGLTRDPIRQLMEWSAKQMTEPDVVRPSMFVRLQHFERAGDDEKARVAEAMRADVAGIEAAPLARELARVAAALRLELPEAVAEHACARILAGARMLAVMEVDAALRKAAADAAPAVLLPPEEQGNG